MGAKDITSILDGTKPPTKFLFGFREGVAGIIQVVDRLEKVEFCKNRNIRRNTIGSLVRGNPSQSFLGCVVVDENNVKQSKEP